MEEGVRKTRKERKEEEIEEEEEWIRQKGMRNQYAYVHYLSIKLLCIDLLFTKNINSFSGFLKQRIKKPMEKAIEGQNFIFLYCLI